MTTFTVWKFEDPEGAAHAATVLKDAEADGLVKIVDHAVMTWPAGADKPETHHSHDDPKRGAAWGAFWGILTGALFTDPGRRRRRGRRARRPGQVDGRHRHHQGRPGPDPHRGRRGHVGAVRGAPAGE